MYTLSWFMVVRICLLDFFAFAFSCSDPKERRVAKYLLCQTFNHLNLSWLKNIHPSGPSSYLCLAKYAKYELIVASVCLVRDSTEVTEADWVEISLNKFISH